MSHDDEYYDPFHELINKIDTHIRIGLKQLPSSFHTRVLEQMQELAVEWGEEVVLRIGITGSIKEGRVGKPNYQLQTISGHRKRAFFHNGELRDNNGFRDCCLSPSLSRSVIHELWNI